MHANKHSLTLISIMVTLTIYIDVGPQLSLFKFPDINWTIHLSVTTDSVLLFCFSLQT
jgi:hypothetical protein